MCGFMSAAGEGREGDFQNLSRNLPGDGNRGRMSAEAEGSGNPTAVGGNPAKGLDASEAAKAVAAGWTPPASPAATAPAQEAAPRSLLDFLAGTDKGHSHAGEASTGRAILPMDPAQRPWSLEQQRERKVQAMPCLTLREDSRGNVTLFGMEPGGELQRLGTVRSGDIVVEVDGKSALGLTEKQVRAMLVGDKGSACKIHWVSPDKATAIDVAQRSSLREHVVVTELLRDIPISSQQPAPHSARDTAHPASTSPVSWKVGRTSARLGSYGAVSQRGDEDASPHDASADRGSGWLSALPWASGGRHSARAGQEVAARSHWLEKQQGQRVLAVTERGERVSLYLPITDSEVGPVPSCNASAAEVYAAEIEPVVARRQWVAVGTIGFLLFFVWLWALNGGPLAGLWARD